MTAQGVLACALAAGGLDAPTARAADPFVELPVDTVQDKIRGGLLGHLLGDLNGLTHEMKYIAEPGRVTEYTPSLPQGAWTDDDTDFEWVYLVEMQRRNRILIPHTDIPAVWQRHINRKFWCANQYARQLMDLGLTPPLTGQLPFNPWSDFNLSGQFVSESWGLIAPGLPRTAARIGLHYTRVAISGEPAQTTQLFDAMIATAFLTDDGERIFDAGLAAVDPRSVVFQVASDVRAWHRQHPNDWRAARRLVKEKYSRHQGAMRDKNGYELNTASVLAALLYGERDFVKTAIVAFNFGWDADNNAATAGTIVGVLKGRRWFMAQGWNIKDDYRNTTRDHMPANETITSFGDRLVELAERVITEQGGSRIERAGQALYRLPVETPHNVEPLAEPDPEHGRLRRAMQPELERLVTQGGDPQQLACAAYQAICLDLAPALREQHPERWTEALRALRQYPKVLGVLFYESPVPAGEQLRQRARAAGLQPPEPRPKIW